MFSYTAINEKARKISQLNNLIRTCERCSLRLERIHAVYGEGDPDAKLLLIAQAPGETEDREGKMFVGPTGRVMDELFRENHIQRRAVYMTNLIKCMLPKNRKPKRNEIEQCGRYLEQEIAIIRPEFLIPMGYHATKYIFSLYGNKDNIPTESIGKLFYLKGIKIYPIPHPSSVLYNASMMQPMKQMFNKIHAFMSECKWYPVCPMKRFYEQGKLDKKWIETYCKGDWESCVRYQMEETGQPHPDNMLPDGRLDNTL